MEMPLGLSAERSGLALSKSLCCLKCSQAPGQQTQAAEPPPAPQTSEDLRKPPCTIWDPSGILHSTQQHFVLYCDGKTSTPADPRTELALRGGQHILQQARRALGGPTACRRGNPMAQAAYLGLVRQLHPLTEAQRQLLEG